MKKVELKINIGAFSIILILFVFALSVFAVLSVRASYADLVLAKKTRSAVTDYYKADAKAEEHLQEILSIYKQNKVTLEKSKEIHYEVMVNEYATLEVKVLLSKKEDGAIAYEIKQWKVKQDEIGDYESDDFTLWDGTIEE